MFASGCGQKTSKQQTETTQEEISTATTETPTTLQAQETNKPLEDMIIKTIKAFQNKDEETLNKLILKDFGIAFVYRPGVMDDFIFSDKISFSEPLPDCWTLDCNIITDYKIHFEELPVFSCESEEWNKPHGIYCDTTKTIKTLSSIVKFRNEHFEENFPVAEIKKFEKIEQKSHTVIVIGKEENVLVFAVTFWQNKWYLTIIHRFEACSA